MRSALLNGAMTTTEAAKYLELSEATLKRWRSKGTGPKYFRLGQRKVRYRQEDLDGWLNGKTRLDTQD